MHEYRRYAVYHTPGGPLGDFGAAWLGWDARSGRAGAPLAGDPALVEAPRRYGFHATLKAPFRLPEGESPEALLAALAAIAAQAAPIPLPLRLVRMGRVLALAPEASPALAALEARLVRELDRFRAPPTAAEIARRHPHRLPPRQRKLLADWGYPHVLGEFRCHYTLTGPLEDPDAVAATLAPLLARLPLEATRMDDLSLVGEAPDGRFHVLQTVPLGG